MTRDEICNGLQEISDEAYSRWVHHQYTRDKLIIGIGTYVEKAIELLKEQVAIKPTKFQKLNDFRWEIVDAYRCGNCQYELDHVKKRPTYDELGRCYCGGCGEQLASNPKFCHNCGRTVKYDATD